MFSQLWEMTDVLKLWEMTGIFTTLGDDRCSHNSKRSLMFSQEGQNTDVHTRQTKHRCSHKVDKTPMYSQDGQIIDVLTTQKNRGCSHKSVKHFLETVDVLPTQWDHTFSQLRGMSDVLPTHGGHCCSTTLWGH